jgi:hypothetical protein
LVNAWGVLPHHSVKENMKQKLPEIPTAGYLSSGKRVKKKHQRLISTCPKHLEEGV